LLAHPVFAKSFAVPSPQSLSHADPNPTPRRDPAARQPITLTRGPGSHHVTLTDAVILIRDLEPFRQARPVWDRTAEMILIAATTKKQADVREATRQSERA